MPSPSDPVISVENFHKAYEGSPAVSGISFDVRPGEILGVIGPNGAGKTTSMRSLAALIPATSGTLRVAGFNVATSPVDVKQRLAYIPDDPRVFPHLTVAEHLAFTAAAFQVPNPDPKAQHLLDIFELTEKRDVAARDLSRGMRQKLAICCGYLYDPIALLFDEPLTGLDPVGIRVLKQSMLDRAQMGAAVLVSSHLLAMVEDICTHILMIHQGEQRFFGTVAELKEEFREGQQEASLEQIFFMATEGRADAESNVDSSADVVEAELVDA